MKLVNGVWISNIPAFEPLVLSFIKNFVCQRCGKCCNLAVQGTAITHDDVRVLAPKLAMSNSAFEAAHCHYVKGGNGPRLAMAQPCPFFREGAGCTVYTDRPQVCQTFPLYTVNYQHFTRIGVHVLCAGAADQLAAFEKLLML